jgi:hypothetical protein
MSEPKERKQRDVNEPAGLILCVGLLVGIVTAVTIMVFSVRYYDLRYNNLNYTRNNNEIGGMERCNEAWLAREFSPNASQPPGKQADCVKSDEHGEQ